MDEKNKSTNQEDTFADAIIGSVIDVDIPNVDAETLADAIEAGASALVGIEKDNNSENEDFDKRGDDTPKRRKLKGSFFIGVASLACAILSVLCCCVPFALPIQLLLVTLAIAFFLLDKKYNGTANFSISALIGIIFSVCIVVFTLIWVGIMLLFNLGIKPKVEPWVTDNILSPAMGFINSIF